MLRNTISLDPANRIAMVSSGSKYAIFLAPIHSKNLNFSKTQTKSVVSGKPNATNTNNCIYKFCPNSVIQADIGNNNF